MATETTWSTIGERDKGLTTKRLEEKATIVVLQV